MKRQSAVFLSPTIKRLIALLLSVLILTVTYAQSNREITGTVLNQRGEPVSGVSVVVKGTARGTTTDAQGRFQISVPASGNVVLEVSSVGFQTQTISPGNQNTITVNMTTNAANMDEVVVIGYGAVRKREVTGAVTSIKSENFNKGAVTDAMQLIQGKVAGLSVVRTNGGDPTQGLQIRLRGTTSITEQGQDPLIVVDGIPGGSLASIAPDDIESIDVLKDGSAAAIYGTRGTNGVILVTTRKGRRGTSQVTYSSRVTTESLLRPVKLLSAGDYRALKQRLMSMPDSAHIRLGMSMIDYGDNTNWYDEITRTPVSHIQELSLSGGAENTTYRFSIFYNNQQGILLNSNREEYRANLNLSQMALNNRLQFNVQLGISNFRQNPVDYNAVRQVMQRNPTEPVYNDDGSLKEFIGSWQYENPVGILTERVRENTGGNSFGNLGVNLNIARGLRATALVGLQTNRTMGGYFEPSYSLPQEAAGRTGFASRDAGKFTQNTFESTLEWSKRLTDHSINVIGGYSYQKFLNEGFNASNTNFITDALGYNNLGSGTFLAEGRAGMGSFKNQSQLIAFFGRAIYNFRDKYFLTASLRHEGSSRFGANNKWGNFPAVSVGWDLVREDFLRNALSPFNVLKLRAGYGVTGNQGILPYLSLSRLAPSGFFFYNGAFTPGYAPVSNANPDLKWETKGELNVGVDWAILKGRVGGTIDVYSRSTRDLLYTYNVPTPPNLYPTTLANGASLRSSGIELTINAVAIRNSDFQWNIDFNADYRKNKVTSLSNGSYLSLAFQNLGDIGPPGISAWTHQLRQGAPLGIIHGWVYEGLTPAGKWKFRDYNPRTGKSDGTINLDDRDDIGNGIPDYYLGLTNTFRYKSWDLSVMARGMFGHQILNKNRIWAENLRFLPRNLMKSALDNFQLLDDPNFSSYYVENGDFLKVDNITLGYNLPLKNSSGIRNLRLYFTGNNLFMITGYKGVDPEVNIGGLTPGIDDRFDYPSTRVYVLGLNVTF
jgi:TonB-dependent starch-binding outer membrane protein SusC